MSIFLKLRYGKRLHIQGIVGFRFNTELIIRKAKISIGKKVGIDSRVSLIAVDGGELVVKDGVFINRGCIAVSRAKISIGERCQLGPNVVIYDHDHKFGTAGLLKGYTTGDIVIEKNCWIGANVTILKNTHIGEGCVIGAGTVVKGDIPAHSLVTSERTLRVCEILDK